MKRFLSPEIGLFMSDKKKIINLMVRTAIFGAIAAILYAVPVLHFSLPIFPSFLEIHLDEIPAFIAGFAYGPICAVGVLIIKTLIKLPFTTTLCVGELIDLIYSVFFIIPAVLIYQKKRNIVGALLGLGVGTLLQLIASFFLNIYVMFPFYSYVYGIPMESILEMCKMVNPNVTDLTYSLGLFIILPFNAIKDGIVIVGTFLLYKALHGLIDKIEINDKKTTE